MLETIKPLKNDICGIINEQTTLALTQSICFNLGWSEMPTFLDNYFAEKHGTSVNEDRELFDYMSNWHERYQNGNIVSTSQVDRNIKISYWNNRKNMSIEIYPSLSLKKAYLESEKGNFYIYKGEDPDYVFEVKLDAFDASWNNVISIGKNLADEIRNNVEDLVFNIFDDFKNKYPYFKKWIRELRWYHFFFGIAVSPFELLGSAKQAPLSEEDNPSIDYIIEAVGYGNNPNLGNFIWNEGSDANKGYRRIPFYMSTIEMHINKLTY